MMNVSVNIDAKFVVAIGVAVGLIIVACRVDGPAAEQVMTSVVNTCRDYSEGLNPLR